MIDPLLRCSADWGGTRGSFHVDNPLGRVVAVTPDSPLRIPDAGRVDSAQHSLCRNANRRTFAV